MINEQLASYIREQLSLKTPKEIISGNLKEAGWSEVDISEAFNPAEPRPVMPSSPHVSFFKKNKKILSIVSVLVLLCLAGGGAYAYYSGAFLSLPALTGEAIESARKAKSASYDTTVNIDFSGIKDGMGGLTELFGATKQISITSKGSYDGSDPKNFKNSSVVSVDLGSSSVAGEIRMLDDTFYGVLTKAPALGIVPMFSSIENKWFSFSYKSEGKQVVGNPLAAFVGGNMNIMDKMTDNQKEDIYRMSRNAHFVKAVKKLSPETIGGVSSYHFIFELDRDGINSYLSLLKDYVNSIGKNDSALSAFDPTAFDKELDNLRDFTGEIWIGRVDKLPHKVSLSFGVQPDEAVAERIKVTVISIMSGWNEPVSIVAPAESTPFEKLISEMMSDSFGQAEQKGQEASIKANLSNMRASAEIFYDSHKNSYSGFCSSSDLKMAQQAVKSAGGTGFVCKENKIRNKNFYENRKKFR